MPRTAQAGTSTVRLPNLTTPPTWRFYRWLSLVILAVALAFSAEGHVRLVEQAGKWLLRDRNWRQSRAALAQCAMPPEKSGNDTDRTCRADESWLLDARPPVPLAAAQRATLLTATLNLFPFQSP